MALEEQANYSVRRGTAQDIINLVSIYSQLEPSAKGDLLTRAVELFSVQEIRDEARIQRAY
jgi:hypothetical protein